MLAILEKGARQQSQWLESLTFKEMDSRQNSITKHCVGTCQWLCDHPAYCKWVSRGRGFLLIKGMPGSGKSTLMKYAVDVESSAGNMVVASFFFSQSGSKIQRTALGLFRSLLYQILPK